jgi:hypothetical protein
MNFAGAPSEWLNLIDSMVPDIMDLVTSTWTTMPPLASDVREDPRLKPCAVCYARTVTAVICRSKFTFKWSNSIRG